jgi:phage regulator Rha-like protein
MNVHFDPTRNPIVSVRDGEAFANSRDVAAFFGKPHDAIVKEIEALLVAVPDMSGRSIVRTEDGPNAFDLTKDGFSLLGKHFKTQRDIKKAVAFYYAFRDAVAQMAPASAASAAVTVGEPLTMSSREIADLTGKRHDHVIRDIRKMLSDLGETSPQIWGKVQTGAGRPMDVASLPKDLTLTLVAGYDVKLRKRIIDRWLELEGRVGGSTAPLIGADTLAELTGRVERQVTVQTGLVNTGLDALKGAVLGFVQHQVAAPLVALRQYLDDRFMAARERDIRMIGGQEAILRGQRDLESAVQRLERSNSTLHSFARRATDPDAFIRPEWCNYYDIYRLAGVDPDAVPRRTMLSTHVRNALDIFCKVNHRQEDMRVWQDAGHMRSYWRKTAVQAWLKSGGLTMIRQHCERHAKPPQGVLPFRKPETK